MKTLLLLFVSRVCLSNAYDIGYDWEYGTEYRLDMTRKAQVLEFTPVDSWTSVVLWKRDEPQATEGKRWKVTGNYFEISALTYRDNGDYTVLDKYGRTQIKKTINVYPRTLEFSLESNQRIDFSGNVEADSCNIFFSPNGESEIQLVHRGRLLDGLDYIACSGFDFSKPCQLSNGNLQSSCSGQFEIRDERGDLAMNVFLEMKSHYQMYFAIGGFILAVVLISCCATRLCCGRSSSRTKPPAVSEAVVRYNEYENEPVAPRQNQLSQPSRTLNAAERSHATPGPLVHDHPTVNLPPAYSSVFSRAQQPDAAAEPLCSDPDPRFELKGLNFNFTPPLGSDSTCCDVYTSDKLNFR